MDQTPCVAFLPSPGMSNLIPFIELAKQLVHSHHLSATIVIPSTAPPTKAQKTVLQTLPKTIHHIFLPPVQLPNDISNAESQIFLIMTLSLPSLKSTLSSLTATTQRGALVVDPFGLEAFDVAKEFGLSPYLFFPSAAMVLLFCLDLPRLPGCVPVHGKDRVDLVQDRSQYSYTGLLGIAKRFGSAKGIILNSFVDLEEGALGKPPVYPVGPLIQAGSSEGLERSECLQWLDGQPSKSVVFVSFGSGGTLSLDQLNELALGLEQSGQRFLWVVRSPDDKSAGAAYFNAQSQNDPISFLPNGFLERTLERGLVVQSWVPQLEVLGHRATGGFWTHGGWNSTLESIVHGVPLIAWPLYAEQKMNAVMLTEGLKVSLRPKSDESGLVGREAIAEVVKSLMEREDGKKVVKSLMGREDGKKVRKRMHKHKEKMD